MRASLLYNTFKSTSYAIVVSQMIKKVLKNSSSHIEFLNCLQCQIQEIKTSPILSLNVDVFYDDLKIWKKRFYLIFQMPIYWHRYTHSNWQRYECSYWFEEMQNLQKWTEYKTRIRKTFIHWGMANWFFKIKKTKTWFTVFYSENSTVAKTQQLLILKIKNFQNCISYKYYKYFGKEICGLFGQIIFEPPLIERDIGWIRNGRFMTT